MRVILTFAIFVLVITGCEDRLAEKKHIIEDILKHAGTSHLGVEDVARIENGRIVELEVWGGKLAVVPEELCNLTGLTALRISGLQVERLPDSIGKLTALTELTASKTPLPPFRHLWHDLAHCHCSICLPIV